MDLLDSFRMLASYNRGANARLYEVIGQLDEAEYRKPRQVSFGNMHALLNHMLLGDQIWMSRFAGGGKTTPALNTVLFEHFAELQPARLELDKQIENFFEKADEDFLRRPLAVLHFFNHQTHHRGQVHVLLSQTEIKPPSLDLHRLLHP